MANAEPLVPEMIPVPVLIDLPSAAPTDRFALANSVLEAVLDDPYTGTLVFDDNLRLLHATSHLSPLLGIPENEVLSVPDALALLSRSMLDPASLVLASQQMRQEGSDASGSTLVLHKKDRASDLLFRLRRIDEHIRVASFQSKVAVEAASATVTEFALRDGLTGLASRPYFEEAVTAALAHQPAEPLAVILLDLDRFKAVNDTLGHPAGDALLRLVGERLKAAVRKNDLVARLGGDEFAVLVQPISGQEEPLSIVQRILDLVQRTYLIEGQLVNVGTSIGVAVCPGDGQDFARLLKNADLAMYHSKVSGKSTYHFFDTAMEQRAQNRRTNELELRRALALRQLEVFYQPQVNTDTGRLFGFEALVRWRHPERGLISPLDFLPVAEEIGLIVPIGEWVLRTACREATKWPDDITVAVNASPLQFETVRFADSVKRALAASGLPGSRLEIEVTEGILLKNDDIVSGILAELRKMDVRIAMDDFGTGYASLSQLAKFPFDKIKIDRSLSGFEGENLKQRAIVRAITALGQSLGVCTLAEGVENQDQIVRLKQDGCSSVQGYFFSKPVPSSALPDIISRLH